MRQHKIKTFDIFIGFLIHLLIVDEILLQQERIQKVTEWDK